MRHPSCYCDSLVESTCDFCRGIRTPDLSKWTDAFVTEQAYAARIHNAPWSASLLEEMQRRSVRAHGEPTKHPSDCPKCAHQLGSNPILEREAERAGFIAKQQDRWWRRGDVILVTKEDFQAVDRAAEIVEFAYEHGFHEEGFDRPAMLRELAEKLRHEVEMPRVQNLDAGLEG